MEQKVFFFPIPNALTLMNIGLPFHVFEPRYRLMVQDAMDKGVPVAVTNPAVDYKGRVFAAGVPEVLQQYSDGRMDIILRGELKGRVEDSVSDRPYKVFTYQELKEDIRLTNTGRFNRECLHEALQGWAKRQLIDGGQMELFKQVVDNELAMVSYATLFLVDNPRARQAILEQQCLEKKVEMILHAWAPQEISLGPYLPALKF